jgi:hypothetical protein
MTGDRSAPSRRRQGRDSLIRLVYVSRRAHSLGPADLAAIEASSQRNNVAARITGLLLVQGGFFYGVMEGPSRRVLARMEIIITDPRHRGMRILREEPIEHRRFANWSFGQIPDDPARNLDPDAPDPFIFDLSRRLA